MIRLYFRVYPKKTLIWGERNGIFLWRGCKIEMSSERAIIVDLRSLSRLSRGLYLQ